MVRWMPVIGLLAILPAPPAGARPLPKPEPAPEARACPEVGEGYVRIAGSNSCVKIGGMVRVEGMKQGGVR